MQVSDVAAGIADRGGNPTQVSWLVQNHEADGLDDLVDALLDLHHATPAQSYHQKARCERIATDPAAQIGQRAKPG